MNTQKIKTWKQIAEALGVTQPTLSKWRRESDNCPQTKDLEAWKLWSANRAMAQEKGGGGSLGWSLADVYIYQVPSKKCYYPTVRLKNCLLENVWTEAKD